MDEMDELKEEYRRVLLKVSIKALRVVEGALKQRDFPGRTDLAMKFLSVLNPAEILEEISETDEGNFLWEDDEDEDDEDGDEDEN
jgi:hypothetical protein